jgi:hypothetical protein
MTAIEPLDYFATCQLEESMVLRLLYRPKKRQCDLVVRYAAEAVSRATELRLQGKDPLGEIPPADFRHFRFKGVNDLTIDRKDLPTDWESYERQLVAKCQVLTEVEHSCANNGFSFAFRLGRFGQHILHYSSALLETRSAAGVEVNNPNRWEYYDIVTRKKIDFFDPFPSL